MAIALSKEKVQAMHSITSIYSFVTIMIVSSLALMLANMLFPNQVVLGTYSISYGWAIYHSIFKLSVISIFVMFLVTFYEWKNKTTFSPKQWMGTYLLVNTLALWGISRFADNLGLGLSSWVTVILLAAFLDIVQGMAMMGLGEYLKKHGQV